MAIDLASLAVSVVSFAATAALGVVNHLRGRVVEAEREAVRKLESRLDKTDAQLAALSNRVSDSGTLLARLEERLRAIAELMDRIDGKLERLEDRSHD